MLPNHVTRMLDAGAWGALAPNVRTREEAQLLVGMVSDQRFLHAAAREARAAVRTEAS
jgi:2-keto-3-deoxy-L-rhamnonate aldolase RhmA